VLKPGESPKFHKVWRGPFLVTSKSDDGLLCKLRHCSTGKEPRAALHANRLKLFQDDRDSIFLCHSIKPKEVIVSHSSPSSDTTTVTDDTWYPIERLLNHKKISNKDYYLVKWEDSSGSQSCELVENISQYAIEQYIIERREKAKRRRKRRV